jgi:hypothetical protein
MRKALVVALSLVSATSSFSCVGVAPDESEMGETTSEVRSDNVWVHLDDNTGINNATLTVANNGTTRCPNGRTAATCRVARLVLPSDCNWECQDGLLSRRGESLLQGRFSANTFVVNFGLDTYTTGLGTRSIYRLTASNTCTSDPCPVGIMRQKINSNLAPNAVTSLDFSRAQDPNFVLDPMRGYAQLTTSAGLIASGVMSGSTFRVDRVWRLETPRPACDVQLIARSHAYSGSETTIREFRTVHEAERATDPSGETVRWIVRTAETPTAVTFTSGFNDLWALRFSVAKDTCAITTLAEH